MNPEGINFFEPIIVVGPGRCGTSLVAGVLHHLGVFMGAEFVLSNESNPDGYWEDKSFRDLNQAVLSKKISAQKWDLEIDQLIKERRALHVPWGWKDPRTCHLLNQYRSHLKNPVFIRCRRNPDAIEKSMLKAYAGIGWTLETARSCRQWRERRLDEFLQSHNPLEIEFESLIKNSKNSVAKMIDFLSLPGVTREKFFKSIQFIRRD
jgi:hypothetical protein